jgi:hypothetical protein
MECIELYGFTGIWEIVENIMGCTGYLVGGLGRFMI